MQKNIPDLARRNLATPMFKQKCSLDFLQLGVFHQDAGFEMLLSKGKQQFQPLPIFLI